MENEVLEFLCRHVRMLHLRSCLVAADRACRISGVLDPLEFLRMSIIRVTRSMAEDLNCHKVLTGDKHKALISTPAQDLIPFFFLILANYSFFEYLWWQPTVEQTDSSGLARVQVNWHQCYCHQHLHHHRRKS